MLTIKKVNKTAIGYDKKSIKYDAYYVLDKESNILRTLPTRRRAQEFIDRFPFNLGQEL